MESLEKIKNFIHQKNELTLYLKSNFFKEIFDKYENLQFIPIHYEECYISELDSFLSTPECYDIPLDKIFNDIEQLYYVESNERKYLDGTEITDFTLREFKGNLENEIYNSIRLHINSKNHLLSHTALFEINEIIKSAEYFIPMLTDDADASLIIRNGQEIEVIKKYN
jgi:hypothetical protein